MGKRLLRQLAPTIFLTLFLTATVFAQGNQQWRRGGTITGMVIDSVNQSPVEYANIVLYSDADSTQIDGTITNESGRFTLENVRPGEYFLEIRFIGFKDRILPDVSLQRGESTHDAGTVYLDRSALNSEEVVVEGTTPAMEYKIDRKIIDVSQQQTSVSGTAVDILENVPSVRVDIEGNVSLRGSESFTVLIDGRPTVLDGNDALQQIPVSSIKNIEIITNPSAKYDPEGTAGIINIVLKKEKFVGSSGMVDLNAGWDDKYGGDALYNYKNDNYTLTLNLDYRNRAYDGTQSEYRRTTNQNQTTIIDADGSSVRGGERTGFRAAFEYNLTPKDQITLNSRYGSRIWQHSSELRYEEWTMDSPDQISQYTNQSRGSRDGDYYDISASYLHQFNQDGHELTMELDHDQWDGKGTSVNQLLSDGNVTSGRKSVETGPSTEYEFQLEYTYPHMDDRKFEAGYEVESEEEEETSKQYIFDTAQNDFVFQPEFSRTMLNKENTQSLFAIYSNEISNFGYQLGVRGEYTYRNISRPDSGAYFNLDRWDFFPTLHTSYSFDGAQQVMASYSRRIDRPRSWYLEPFLTWRDAYNVSQGNPTLVPEYIDSYEVGYQTRLGKSVFNFETYARRTHNKIERIQKVYPDADNVILHTAENVGSDFSLGSEFNIRYDILKQWNINLMGDLYRYQVWGDYAGESFDRQSFTWSARINNTFKFNDVWQIQWDGMYRSPRVSSQERDAAYFRSNLAVRRDFFDRKVTTTLQIRDLFGTGKWESEREGVNFYTESLHEIDTPIVMLSVKININNYRQDRRGGPNGGIDGGMEGGGEF